jgi:hypothetical protein
MQSVQKIIILIISYHTNLCRVKPEFPVESIYHYIKRRGMDTGVPIENGNHAFGFRNVDTNSNHLKKCTLGDISRQALPLASIMW